MTDIFFVIPALYLENKKERFFKNISVLIAQGSKYFGCSIQNTLGVKVQNLKKGFNTGGTSRRINCIIFQSQNPFSYLEL